MAWIKVKDNFYEHDIDTESDYTVIFSAFGPTWVYRRGRCHPKEMLSKGFYKEGLFQVWDFKGTQMEGLILDLKDKKVCKNIM